MDKILLNKLDSLTEEIHKFEKLKLENDKKEKEFFDNLFNQIEKDYEYALVFFIKNFKSIMPFFNCYKENFFESKTTRHFLNYNYYLKDCSYKSYGKNLIFKSADELEINFKKLQKSNFGKITFSNSNLKIHMIDFLSDNKHYGFVVKKNFYKIIDFYFYKVSFANDIRMFEELIQTQCTKCKYYTICDKGNDCKKTF